MFFIPYTNFYEFSGDKDVWEKVGKFQPHPWTVEVSGLVANPQKFAIEDLIAKMPIEECREQCYTSPISKSFLGAALIEQQTAFESNCHFPHL